MKGPLNPPLKVGDIVMCYHMDGELSVTPGTKGKVKSISRDPFEPEGEFIYNVEWENGSTLGLLSSQDAWKKVEQETIQESSNLASYEFFKKNPEIFENFDWRFLRKFLYQIRESGVVNMIQSAPFLYSGKEWIKRYHGENQEDNEPFQEVLDNADKAKDKMIQGLIKYMESKNMDMDDMDKVNRLIEKIASKIVNLYISFD